VKNAIQSFLLNILNWLKVVKHIKDYENYILMRKLKDGVMYCITKGILITDEKELVKLT